MGSAGDGAVGPGAADKGAVSNGAVGNGVCRRWGCGVGLCPADGEGTRSPRLAQPCLGWAPALSLLLALSLPPAEQRGGCLSLSSRLLPSRLRPTAARPAGAGDGVHRGPAAAHAVLCRRGELPLQFGPPGELALWAPSPAPLLLPDPQQWSRRLPPQGWPALLGLARVPPVRTWHGWGWARGQGNVLGGGIRRWCCCGGPARVMLVESEAR